VIVHPGHSPLTRRKRRKTANVIANWIADESTRRRRAPRGTPGLQEPTRSRKIASERERLDEELHGNPAQRHAEA
jgi:hypothetical protein